MKMTIKLYELRSGGSHWSDSKRALVAAYAPGSAKACMSVGSDSPWMSVASCRKVGEMVVDPATIDRFYPEYSNYYRFILITK